jgi:hypothetical protein
MSSDETNARGVRQVAKHLNHEAKKIIEDIDKQKGLAGEGFKEQRRTHFWVRVQWMCSM